MMSELRNPIEEMLEMLVENPYNDKLHDQIVHSIREVEAHCSALETELEAVKRERELAVREISVKTDLLHKSVKTSSILRKEPRC